MASTTPTRSQTLPFGVGLTTRARVWLASLGVELPLILGLMAVGLIAQAINMFHYPSFTLLDDEGIYTGQAWSVLSLHRLTPYTYFYDHAPGGWLLMAVWMLITGGPLTFGSPVDSGRVMMLLLHLAMIPLLYQVARKLGAGVAGAALATLLFSLSPLAVFYQRLVLLDNIMLFWVLLSLNLLLDGWGRLSRVIVSGACFGLALLSKETAIFLLPAMLFLAFQQRWNHQGRFAIGSWIFPMLSVLSLYPLYALLKGELLPADQSSFYLSGDNIKGTGASRASLWDALIWQSSRGSQRGSSGPFSFDNDFWYLLQNDWLSRDGILVLGGIAAIGINLFRGIRDRRSLVVGLLGLLPMLYLARGGVVLNYYILFAIPFLCLNLAFAVSPLLKRLPRLLSGGVAVLALVVFILFYWESGTFQPLYQETPDQAGREAVSWIKQNIPSQSLIITRDNLWTDLREPGQDGVAFPNVHSHWKVAFDPDVREGVFKNDWRNVDYLIMTPGLIDDFKLSNDTLALDALAHAHLVKRWTSDIGTKNLHDHQIIELWKVGRPGVTETAVLSESAAYISNHFENQGAYADSTGVVSSESQSYALLRAVWSENEVGFKRTWSWTQNHMVDANGLLVWQWQNGKVVDTNNGADADTDTALALLLAGQHWSNQQYLEAGKRLVQNIWQHEVVTINGAPYLAAGTWAAKGSQIIYNPSYFSPYAYRIFQQVDSGHNWLGLVDSGYQLLLKASESKFGFAQSAYLPPDWMGLDRKSGEILTLPLDKGDTSRYTFDAARTYWRVALDLRWSKDDRAKQYLSQAGFLRDEVARRGLVASVYGHDGSVVQENPNLVGSAGAVAALLTLDPDKANALYTSQIVGDTSRSNAGVYWGDGSDLYSQEWGWFATALYANALPDIWSNPNPASSSSQGK